MMRCGGRSGRNTAVAATASGGATTAPSAIAAAHGRSGMSRRATTATAAVVRPTANDDEPCDRRPVVLEVSERRVVRRIKQNGCDEERERKLGRQRERRRGREETRGVPRQAPGTRDTVRQRDARRPPG